MRAFVKMCSQLKMSKMCYSQTIFTKIGGFGIDKVLHHDRRIHGFVHGVFLNFCIIIVSKWKELLMAIKMMFLFRK